MKELLYISFKLESDATFGRGDGIAGLLNQEVQHDEYGLPYISGKTLKGLLVSFCAEIMTSLMKLGKFKKETDWHDSAERLFGKSGSLEEDESSLHIGDGKLPEDLREAVKGDWVDKAKYSPGEILDIMTAVRYRTEIDKKTQSAKENSLRAERVILKGMNFEAPVILDKELNDKDLALLAACVKAFDRVGSDVSRGRGKIKSDLLSRDKSSVLDKYFRIFKEAVLK